MHHGRPQQDPLRENLTLLEREQQDLWHRFDEMNAQFMTLQRRRVKEANQTTNGNAARLPEMMLAAEQREQRNREAEGKAREKARENRREVLEEWGDGGKEMEKRQMEGGKGGRMVGKWTLASPPDSPQRVREEGTTGWNGLVDEKLGSGLRG
jgi:hypothetical protein